MEELLRFLNLLHPMSAELQVFLIQIFQKEIHRSNKTLLEKEEICDWICFVEKGLLKAYLEMEDGSEKVIWYRKSGEVASSVSSFYKNQPSKLIIRTMEETHIRRIRKPVLQSLFDRFPEFNINARLITEACCIYHEDRCILNSLPLKDRYRTLHNNSSWLLIDERIKDFMLASYLNIDRATYSRFKGKKY